MNHNFQNIMYYILFLKIKYLVHGFPVTQLNFIMVLDLFILDKIMLNYGLEERHLSIM